MKALHPSPAAQSGAALIVGLVMLMLITLLVTSAFQLSNTGLQSVGNMQTRDEAIAAGNKALEQVMSSPFTNAPTADSINVDIDNDDRFDYVVDVAPPTCISAQDIHGEEIEESSVTLEGMVLESPPPFYRTVWDLDATVRDTGGAGTFVRVRQGVRVLLSETQYIAVCSS